MTQPERGRRPTLQPDGEASITDGPYAEAKEQLAGYFVVECASRDRAIEIAQRFPDARFGAVEVRTFASVPPPPPS